VIEEVITMEIDLARLDKIESLDLKDLDEDNFLTL